VTDRLTFGSPVAKQPNAANAAGTSVDSGPRNTSTKPHSAEAGHRIGRVAAACIHCGAKTLAGRQLFDGRFVALCAACWRSNFTEEARGRIADARQKRAAQVFAEWQKARKKQKKPVRTEAGARAPRRSGITIVRGGLPSLGKRR